MGIFRRVGLIGAAIAATLGFGGSSVNAGSIGHVGRKEPMESPFNSYHSRGKGGRRSTTKTGNAAALKRASIKRRNKRKNKLGSK